MSKKSALAVVMVDPAAPLLNELAVAGSNHPPEPVEEEAPTPYDMVKARIDDLVGELRLSADGAKVETQELCDYFANIEAMLRKAIAEAKIALADEKSELSKRVQEIQDRYNLLIGENKSITGSAILAVATAKKIQEPFLVAKQQAIDDERERLRLIAVEAQRKAEEALRASSPENLAEREEAEQLVVDARVANAIANKAESTTAKAGGTFGRSTGLHTVYSAELIDPVAALKHYCKVNARAVREFLQGLADAHIRFGSHAEDELPGFKITSEQKVR